jgi:hypothetical protein
LAQPAEDLCGPTALAMVLTWAGATTSPEALAARTLTPGLDGTLRQDLIGASRRAGMTPRTLGASRELLAEVAAGHPVIVLQNVRYSWWPKWHYAVVVGYDLAADEVYLHPGVPKTATVPARAFLSDWRRDGAWAMVVEPR